MSNELPVEKEWLVFGFDGVTFAAQSCSTNTCHNDGTNGAPPAYTWGTTIDGTDSCTDCHAATPATEAHAEHLAGTVPGAFGITIPRLPILSRFTFVTLPRLVQLSLTT